MLAYPPDASARPLRERAPLGRFILVQDGYLEPATHAAGRLISATGSVTGRIGEAAYIYPVITAQQRYLWPREHAHSRSRVMFGLGVSIGHSADAGHNRPAWPRARADNGRGSPI